MRGYTSLRLEAVYWCLRELEKILILKSYWIQQTKTVGVAISADFFLIYTRISLTDTANISPALKDVKILEERGMATNYYRSNRT